jgi:hypothetical protein
MVLDWRGEGRRCIGSDRDAATAASEDGSR